MSIKILADPKFPGLLGEILERHGDVCLVASGLCMVPSIRPGDTIVVREVPTCSLQIGEIVLSKSPIGPPVSHRIVGFTHLNYKRSILLRADQLKAQVETVRECDIIGMVIRVRRDDGTSISMCNLTHRIKAFLRAKALLHAHYLRNVMVIVWMNVTALFKHNP